MTAQFEIKKRFPYMFSDKNNISISIPSGWMHIFEQLCKDIDLLLGQDKQGFHFVQCKEKFGSARWYWQLGTVKNLPRVDIITDIGVIGLTGRPDKSSTPETLREKIAQLVDMASAKTQHSCIVCGAPSQADHFDYWVLQLCEDHMRMRRSDAGLPSFWPTEDER